MEKEQEKEKLTTQLKEELIALNKTLAKLEAIGYGAHIAYYPFADITITEKIKMNESSSS